MRKGPFLNPPTEEQRIIIIEMALAKHKWKDIAEAVGISITVVRNIALQLLKINREDKHDTRREI